MHAFAFPTGFSGGFLIFLIVVIALFIYFIPSIVAASRGNHNRVSIFVLNLFLGWSFVGWVISLVWAFKAD